MSAIVSSTEVERPGLITGLMVITRVCGAPPVAILLTIRRLMVAVRALRCRLAALR